ncbi:MAG: porin [Desulfobacterales bacterium]|jgi:predicted porin
MKKFSQLGIIVLTMALTILLILPAANALDFKVSGQVNRAVLWGDNGNDDDVKFVDNENSSTRFRFTGSNEFNENWSVGFKWENQMESNSSVDDSGDLDIGSNGDVGDITFTERHMDIYFQHSKFGKLSLGQGDTASNGTSEVDLSGTTVVNYSSIADMAGAFFFRDDDDNVITSIADSFSNFDGLSRRDRIRYDTPKFGPVFFSASYMNGQSYDFAGRLAYQWEGFGKLAAAASWLPADTQRFTFKQYSGSVSFLFDFGLNLTFAGANRYDTPGDDEPYNLYGKVGYKMEKWAFSVDYTYSEDVDEIDDEATSIGLAAVWQPWKSVELYGSYRWHDLDRDADQRAPGVGNAEDLHAVMIGSRVKF